MNKQLTNNSNTLNNIFIKYKKWIIAVIGVQLIPTVLFFGTILGIIIYNYLGSDIRQHPYKQYIYGGYNVGVEEGDKDKDVDESKGFGNRETKYLDNIPWLDYKETTESLQKQALAEKDNYLNQFPASERGGKLAELHSGSVILPLQQKLDLRFSSAIDFYTDYVDKKIQRHNYKSDGEYETARDQEAWKLGFEYGYAIGRAFGKQWHESME